MSEEVKYTEKEIEDFLLLHSFPPHIDRFHPSSIPILMLHQLKTERDEARAELQLRKRLDAWAALEPVIAPIVAASKDRE